MALSFSIAENQTLTVDVRELVIAGWTGRNRAAIEHHIEELAAIGVPRPSAVPLYYRVSQTLVTQQQTTEVLGDESSGEVEPVLIRAKGCWWLSVGSDHTDRKVEAYSVAVSKQMCAKPLATEAWRWEDVATYADELILRSEVFEDGRWITYQEGRLESIQPLSALLAGYLGDQTVDDGLVMFCGTLAARPNAAGRAVRPTPQLRLAIEDPRRGCRLVHEYSVRCLPVIS